MNLNGRTVGLRLAEIDDAAFILRLRKDPLLNSHLSPTDGDLESQIKWLRLYKQREHAGTEFYFIIHRLPSLTPCGTVRIYDIREGSFCWGSWILNDQKSRYAALESAFLVYRFGFQHLGMKQSHFDVRQHNTRVISFHEKMGAQRVAEDDLDVYFHISADAVQAAKSRMSRFID